MGVPWPTKLNAPLLYPSLLQCDSLQLVRLENAVSLRYNKKSLMCSDTTLFSPDMCCHSFIHCFCATLLNLSSPNMRLIFRSTTPGHSHFCRKPDSSAVRALAPVTISRGGRCRAMAAAIASAASSAGITSPLCAQTYAYRTFLLFKMRFSYSERLHNNVCCILADSTLLLQNLICIQPCATRCTLYDQASHPKGTMTAIKHVKENHADSLWREPPCGA